MILCQCKNNCSAGCCLYPTTFKTLNGVDGTDAGKMIQHFKELNTNDKAPTPECVWISKEMLHDIVVLLESEKKAQIAQGRTDTTDGIRVYFATPPNIAGPHPVHTILLVSTKDNGLSKLTPHQCKSRHNHSDYYEHSLNASLFKLKAFGEVCTEGKKCPGDSLYVTCTTCAVENQNCKLFSHYIPRSRAEVMVQHFSDHYINTYSVWFDFKFWKDLDRDKVHNGIHIYFATHPPMTDDSDYSSRNTFVITTTKNDSKLGTVDYFDCKKTDLVKITAHFAWLPGQDQGELCPDNCN